MDSCLAFNWVLRVQTQFTESGYFYGNLFLPRYLVGTSELIYGQLNSHFTSPSWSLTALVNWRWFYLQLLCPEDLLAFFCCSNLTVNPINSPLKIHSESHFFLLPCSPRLVHHGSLVHTAALSIPRPLCLLYLSTAYSQDSASSSSDRTWVQIMPILCSNSSGGLIFHPRLV